jgi:hypothetical protein
VVSLVDKRLHLTEKRITKLRGSYHDAVLASLHRCHGERVSAVVARSENNQKILSQVPAQLLGIAITQTLHHLSR